MDSILTRGIERYPPAKTPERKVEKSNTTPLKKSLKFELHPVTMKDPVTMASSYSDLFEDLSQIQSKISKLDDQITSESYRPESVQP